MSELARLNLHIFGAPLGVLAYRQDLAQYALDLDPAFIATGHELSPLKLGLETFSAGPRIFKRGGESPFADGLPGLLADSLPDKWGDKILLAEVPGLRTSIGRLAAIGERGPGAISFEPVLGGGADLESTEAVLKKLAHDAERLLKTPSALTSDEVSDALKKGGSPLGGIQPKVSAHLPFDSDQHPLERILVGGPTPAGHRPCVVKLSHEDGEATAPVEYAFWRMAQKAGIRVPHACLIHDGERRHFASVRFDRYQAPDQSWRRRHTHTLSGFLHKEPTGGAIDYEDFLRLTRNLCGAQEAQECFRRILFNLLSANRDDHGRNHSFLYDENTRLWNLSPAYDLTPGVFTNFIALSWQGSMSLPTRFGQITALASTVGISPRTVRALYSQVEEATLGSWNTLAAEAHVPPSIIDYWTNEMVRQTAPLRADYQSHR